MRTKIKNTESKKKKSINTSFYKYLKKKSPEFKYPYTSDFYAQALIALCMAYESSKDENNIKLLQDHLNEIQNLQQDNGTFLNEDAARDSNSINKQIMLENFNGQVVWALGYLVSKKSLLPEIIITKAEILLLQSLGYVEQMESARAIAFSIKGLYFYLTKLQSIEVANLIERLASRLANVYKGAASISWGWFERHFNKTNSILPEAMLYAYLISFNEVYKKIAMNSFDFLLTQAFNAMAMESLSHEDPYKNSPLVGGRPVDITYTIMTLSIFYDVLKDETYKDQMKLAFDRLKEYDVHDSDEVESYLCYTIANLTMAKYIYVMSSRIPEWKSPLKSILLMERFAKLAVIFALALLGIRKLFGKNQSEEGA